MGIYISVAVAAVALFLATWKRFGSFGAACALCLFTLAAFPRQLTGSNGLPHPGLSTAEPELTNFGLLMAVLAVCCLLTEKSRPSFLAFVPLGIYLLVSTSFLWAGNLEQLAGVQQLLLAVCAWAAGAWLLRDAGTHGRQGRLFSFLLLILVLVQLSYAVLQFFGIIGGNIIPNEDGGGLTRVSGSLSNANNLGKVLVLATLLLLPLTLSNNLWTRRASLCGVLLALIPIALTGGRAVAIGAVLTLLVWALMLPGKKSWSTKILLPLGVSVVGTLFAASFVARFQEDPTGGSRSGLTQVALEQIAANPLFGIGANSYVSVVGTFDPVTGSGLPVHNSFLLMTAEIGLVGAVLLFGPLAATLVHAVRHHRRTDYVGDYARALLASTPAIILIAATGWGMTSGHVMTFWFFTMGAVAQQLKRPVEQPSQGTLTGPANAALRNY
ncbi:O-antigen ligase family protein [Arthrobacter sp. S39]|uniref:O-antigen ligase family protein n=1 Tax=Arthrobacter sp. S39 TaxID=2509720 RepID=UPI0010380BE6|nr:O-antigen ligase family protein [Arthrobacter sp. S39]TAP39118.1 O-antigen ligase family protein [Arthrobacter sp. S39]